MKKFPITLRWVLVCLAMQFLSGTAHAQLYSKFGPVTGVLKGNSASPQTSLATVTDIANLWACVPTTLFLKGDGTCATATTAAAGADTQIQYNASGAFAGSTDFTWTNTSKTLQLNSGSATTSTVRPGDNAAGAGRDLSVRAGASTGGNGIGGNLTLQAGFGNGTGQGGSINMTAGDSGVTGTNNAGNVNITGGRGQTPGPAFAGNVNVTGGTVLADGDGGSVNITGSAGVGTNRNGGNVTVNLGVATGSGNAGLFSVLGGRGGVIGAPTGGAKGVGTINAVGLYVGGVAVGTGGAVPGGTTGQMQYNNGGVFGGDAGLSTNATGTITLSNSTVPTFILKATTGGTDQKNQQCYYNFTALQYVCSFLNDALSVEDKFLVIGRGTGVAVASITLGNATDNPTFVLQGSGAISRSASINGTLSATFTNTNNGIAAANQLVMTNDTPSNAYFGIAGSGNTAAQWVGGPVGAQAYMGNSGVIPLTIGTNNTYRGGITSSGNWQFMVPAASSVDIRGSVTGTSSRSFISFGDSAGTRNGYVGVTGAGANMFIESDNGNINLLPLASTGFVNVSRDGGATFNAIPLISFGEFNANAGGCSNNSGVFQQQNMTGTCTRNSVGIYTVNFNAAYTGRPTCLANATSSTAGAASVNTTQTNQVTVSTVNTAFAVADIGSFWVTCIGF